MIKGIGYFIVLFLALFGLANVIYYGDNHRAFFRFSVWAVQQWDIWYTTFVDAIEFVEGPPDPGEPKEKPPPPSSDPG